MYLRNLLASAIPVLEHNFTLNKHHFANNVFVEAAVLDWEDEDLPPCAQGSIDLILYALISSISPSSVMTFRSLFDSNLEHRTGWPTLHTTPLRSLR